MAIDRKNKSLVGAYVLPAPKTTSKFVVRDCHAASSGLELEAAPLVELRWPGLGLIEKHELAVLIDPKFRRRPELAHVSIIRALGRRECVSASKCGGPYRAGVANHEHGRHRFPIVPCH